MDHFPLVTNSWHYVKLIQCSFRLLPMLVEMGIASLYLACLGGLELGVRVCGWCGKEDLSGPEPEDNSLISVQLLSFLASGKGTWLSSTQLLAWLTSAWSLARLACTVFLHSRIPRAFLVTMKCSHEYPHGWRGRERERKREFSWWRVGKVKRREVG